MQILASGQARYIFGLLLLARGIAYVPIAFADPSTYTTSYTIQAAIMPLWIYCIAQLLIGSALILTTSMSSRLNWYGRLVSVLAFTLAILFLVVWLQSRAYTAVSSYAVMVAAMLAQSIHVPRIETG